MFVACPGIPNGTFSHGTPGEMVRVPAGSFLMGNPWDDPAGPEYYVAEKPVHEVTLSAYDIGKYEVTTLEYADVLNWAQQQNYLDPLLPNSVSLDGHTLLDIADSSCPIEYTQGEFMPISLGAYSLAYHPVIEVTWYGAVAYCNWLSEMNGLAPYYDLDTWDRVEPPTDGFRLPTEAEWERAAAWDQSTRWRYAFQSNTITRARCNYESDNPVGLNTGPKTTPIGFYNGENPDTADSRSPVGCYDLSGNVWEWCHDWYNVDFYSVSPSQDPLGPDDGFQRVTRGGGWSDDTNCCRCAGRYFMTPESASEYFGFRVARSVSEGI